MIFNTKCLWTFSVTLLFFVFKNNLCDSYDTLGEKGDIYKELSENSNPDGSRNGITEEERAKIATDEKRGWDSNFAVWGKRLYENDSPNKGDSELPVAQLSPDKRKWSKFVSWGKREQPVVNEFDPNGLESSNKRELEVLSEPLNIDEPVWSTQLDTSQHVGNDLDKRKWQALTTWGKRRYMDGPVRSGWSGFTSWGKRNSDLNPEEIDKRKWQFSTWGKRNADPYTDEIDKRNWAKFASWGKRDFDSLPAELEKRAKWAKFTSWGKRSEIDSDLEAAKRKWAKFATWGKRFNGIQNDKDRWSRFAVWGKREDDTNDNVEKRKWSKFSSWGKRPRNPKAWLSLNTWGKRRWSGLTTWGKRSGNDVTEEAVAKKLLRFFDINGMYIYLSHFIKKEQVCILIIAVFYMYSLLCLQNLLEKLSKFMVI